MSAPSGHGRPRQKLYFRALRAIGVKVLGPGCPPGYPPGRPRNIPPKNSLFTIQPEIIAKTIPMTFFHVTEMRFFKKIILKQFMHVILSITNEDV